MLKILAGASMLALAALPAQAHAANVYDANGKLIGPLVGVFEIVGGDGNGNLVDKFTGLVVTKLNGTDQFLSVSARGGFVNTDPKFYFASSDCTGTPFLPYDPFVEILPHAVFDGQVWALVPQQWGGLNPGSYLQNQACSQLPPGFNFVGTPAVRAVVTFSAPFSVK